MSKLNDLLNELEDNCRRYQMYKTLHQSVGNSIVIESPFDNTTISLDELINSLSDKIENTKRDIRNFMTSN